MECICRDPKNITSLEYGLFYQATFRDFGVKPLAWNHFSGDLGSGVSFRALLFVPGKLSENFWQGSQLATDGIRLLVKRTFITSDLGEDYLPKWACWVKAIIDGARIPTFGSKNLDSSHRFS
jgi:heat shock protein beta